MENENKTAFDPTAMPTATTTGGNSTPSKFNFAEIKNNKPLFYGIIGGTALLVVIIIVVIILNAGSKLVCTKDGEYGGVKETEKVVFKFNKGLTKVTRTMTYDYTNDSETTEEDLKKQVEEFNKEKDAKTEEKYKVDISLSGKVVTLTATYTAESFKEQFKAAGQEDQSMEGYKKYFENNKYTCK